MNKVYESPTIEVVEIEFEGAILTDSPILNGTITLPGILDGGLAF